MDRQPLVTQQPTEEQRAWHNVGTWVEQHSVCIHVIIMVLGVVVGIAMCLLNDLALEDIKQSDGNTNTTSLPGAEGGFNQLENPTLWAGQFTGSVIANVVLYVRVLWRLALHALYRYVHPKPCTRSLRLLLVPSSCFLMNLPMLDSLRKAIAISRWPSVIKSSSSYVFFVLRIILTCLTCDPKLFKERFNTRWGQLQNNRRPMIAGYAIYYIAIVALTALYTLCMTNGIYDQLTVWLLRSETSSNRNWALYAITVILGIILFAFNLFYTTLLDPQKFLKEIGENKKNIPLLLATALLAAFSILGALAIAYHHSKKTTFFSSLDAKNQVWISAIVGAWMNFPVLQELAFSFQKRTKPSAHRIPLPWFLDPKHQLLNSSTPELTAPGTPTPGTATP